MRRLSLIAVGAATAYVLGLVGLYSVGAGHVRRHNIEAATMVFAVVCLAALDGQLFSNGFAEAFASIRPPRGDGPVCHFEWARQGFYEPAK